MERNSDNITKMNNCRICLILDVSKDMAELPDQLDNVTKPNIEEIMLFSLDIQVSKDSESSTKLCTKCFYSVVFCYKFKSMALKNNKYLQSLSMMKHAVVKIEKLPDDDVTVCGLDDSDGENEEMLLSTEDDMNLLYEAVVTEHQEEEKKPTLKKTRKKPGRPRKAEASTIKQLKKRSGAVENEKDERSDTEDIKNQDLICYICGEIVKDLPAHLLAHDYKNPLAKKQIVKCRKCNELFESRRKMLRHYWDNHSVSKIECSECNKLVRCLTDHRRRSHKNLPKVPCGHCAGHREAVGRQKVKFQCDECPRSFQMRHRLLRHSRLVHSKEKTMQCAYCDKVFERYCYLQDHEATHTIKDASRLDNPQIDEADGGLMYKCKQCGDEFANKALWTEHRDRAHAAADAASGRRQCDLCFKYYVDLRAHKLTVHERHKMPFGCDKCGKRFMGSRGLEEHRRCHTDERPLACPHCPKRFRLSAVLDTHVKSVHQKLKGLVCQHCSKEFFKKNHLERHMFVHSSERPFVCVECGKRFKDPKCLKSHSRTHSDERPFECKICHKYFRTQSLVKSHMLTHTKERGLVCRYCPAAFKRGDYRLDHERKKHLAFLNTQVENKQKPAS